MTYVMSKLQGKTEDNINAKQKYKTAVVLRKMLDEKIVLSSMAKYTYAAEQKSQWEQNYFFTDINEKPVCVICGKSLSTFSKYNIIQHYNILHKQEYDKLDESPRLVKFHELRAFIGRNNNNNIIIKKVGFAYH